MNSKKVVLKKVTLTLDEINILKNDLLKLLNKKLSLGIKRDIRRKISEISPIIEGYKATELEYFKKYGVENNGRYSLLKDVSQDIVNEIVELGNKTEVISHRFTFDTFSALEDEHPYSVFLKLFE